MDYMQELGSRDRNLIGLSLSSCIRDMAMGNVHPAQVKFIVAGTNWTFPQMLDEAIERYSSLEWSKCAERAAYLLKEFWERGLIIQPRNYGYNSHNVAGGYWAIQVHQPKVVQAVIL